jgi:acyl-CoA synthetase (AMP-forming)/AMP-acid ligase II
MSGSDTASFVACPGTPIDAATVPAFAAGELPRYARADRILLLDALPRTPTGKVQKQQLRSLAGGASSDAVAVATLSSPHERN